jgi:hypothetical protein
MIPAMLHDLGGVVLRPGERLPEIARKRGLAGAAAVVVASGVIAAGLSLLTTFLEPEHSGDAGRAAGVGFSIALPFLFVGVWIVDAWIIDAIAQLMGCPTRRRALLVTTGYAVSVLIAFEAVRVIQALIDRGGGDAADAVATSVGLVTFAIVAWFVCLLAIAARAVYGLPPLSALAAALAPSAAMATLLMILLVVASALHGAGAI